MHEANLQKAVDLVHRLQQDRLISVNNFTVRWTLEELHAISWNTANSTGALAYMGYSKVLATAGFTGFTICKTSFAPYRTAEAGILKCSRQAPQPLERNW
jgi:hypothetical protein